MNVRSLATVVSGASRRGAGPLSTRTYVPHNSYPSIMSRASDSRFAICKKQNSGVLIKKPSPASTNDLSGEDGAKAAEHGRRSRPDVDAAHQRAQGQGASGRTPISLGKGRSLA